VSSVVLFGRRSVSNEHVSVAHRPRLARQTRQSRIVKGKGEEVEKIDEHKESGSKGKKGWGKKEHNAYANEVHRKNPLGGGKH